MQDDVVALFAYDRWANTKALDAWPVRLVRLCPYQEAGQAAGRFQKEVSPCPNHFLTGFGMSRFGKNNLLSMRSSNSGPRMLR